MPDYSKLVQKRDRGQLALDLVNNPLIVDFFEVAESQLYNKWKGSIQGGVEEREQIFLENLGLQAFKDFLQRTIIDGKMAAKDLEEK